MKKGKGREMQTRGSTEQCKEHGRLWGAAFGAGNLVDDALKNDDLDVDVAGDIGKELGDVIADGGGGKADDVTAAGSIQAGLAAGHVEIGDAVIDGEADDVGIVEHAFAVVSPRPKDLQGGVRDAAGNTGIG